MVRCKNDGNAFLQAMPAAKERGDRGRWNYPSQATAAFEMVLSPGAGITSAAGGLAFLPHPPDPLPGGKGENQSLFRRGLPPPAPPATGWEAALDLLWENGTFSFSGKVFHSGQGIQAAQVFPMPHGYKPDSKPTAEAAKPILQNPKSQPPSDTARKPQVRAPT